MPHFAASETHLRSLPALSLGRSLLLEHVGGYLSNWLASTSRSTPLFGVSKSVIVLTVRLSSNSPTQTRPEFKDQSNTLNLVRKEASSFESLTSPLW
ncbi:hypothetical protein RRG08_063247 [Elysia crispata]|uniref:Uncharacterized protein n=1 Tax=Elysia crispata TaxID=231223 RepID=A0AAE0Y9T9_9GAST|nr:hypothetical protein RRG08_063247 [Elysia crispata]